MAAYILGVEWDHGGEVNRSDILKNFLGSKIKGVVFGVIDDSHSFWGKMKFWCCFDLHFSNRQRNAEQNAGEV